MSTKTGNEIHDRIVHLYTVDHLSADRMAPILLNEFNVKYSRTWIIRVLNRRGIDTRKGHGTRVPMICDVCGKSYSICRAKYHERESDTAYCSRACYDEFLKINKTTYNRAGRRDARAVLCSILNVADLPAGSIVHHIGQDQTNNAPENLILFKTQSAHLRCHRNCRVDNNEIIFAGCLDSPEYRKAVSAGLLTAAADPVTTLIK